MRHKLSIGLLIGDWNIRAWQYDLLAEVIQSDYASIDLIIQPTADPSETLRRGLAVSMYDLFQRFETRHPEGKDACDIVNARNLLGDVDRITLPFGPDCDCERRNASRLEKIELREIDIIFALDDISSIDSLVDVCKYGVWFYDYCYSTSTRVDSSWVGFQEVLRRKPFIHSALIVRSVAFQSDRTADSAYSSINVLSHAITRSEHFWKIRAFVPRALRDLYIHGNDQFFQKLQINAGTRESTRSLSPANLRGFSILESSIVYVIWRLKRNISRKFSSQKWILMFQLGGNWRELGSYIKMHPPKDWFWADPCVIRQDDDYYIFFEEASVASWHGHISVIRMDESGNYTRPTRVLERPYHLSYPFVFEWQRAMYLIAETAENRTIEVYKCRAFPDDWEFECTLMDNVSAYDTTLFEYDETWWLFANIREHDGASSWDELCLFSADSPLSDDWQPHPLNPIVSDVRSARPAGRIFCENGKIYRPSQNSSYRYGYGLNFSEILELTKTTYKERIAECLEPDWDPSITGLHTFSASGELTVVDAIHRTRNLTRRFRRPRLSSASKDE